MQQGLHVESAGSSGNRRPGGNRRRREFPHLRRSSPGLPEPDCLWVPLRMAGLVPENWTRRSGTQMQVRLSAPPRGIRDARMGRKSKPCRRQPRTGGCSICPCRSPCNCRKSVRIFGYRPWFLQRCNVCAANRAPHQSLDAGIGNREQKARVQRPACLAEGTREQGKGNRE